MLLTTEEKVSTLYRELSRCIKENKDEQCLEISRVIFELSKTKKACQYLVIASIRNGLYQEAIDLLEKNDNINDLLYEKAYCYYRTYQLEKAQHTLDKLKKTNTCDKLAILHLEAQIV